MHYGLTVEELLTEWRYVPMAQWAEAMDLANVAVQVGFAGSKSEARRLMQQGGIRYDNVKTNDPNAYVMFPPGPEPISFGMRHVVISIDRSRP
jgi:tyrosyl-tRNA synthetase